MLPVILGEYKTAAEYRMLAVFFRHKRIFKMFQCCDLQQGDHCVRPISRPEYIALSARTPCGPGVAPLSITLWSIWETWHPVGVRLCGVTFQALPVTTVAFCRLGSLSHMSEFGIKNEAKSISTTNLQHPFLSI